MNVAPGFVTTNRPGTFGEIYNREEWPVYQKDQLCPGQWVLRAVSTDKDSPGCPVIWDHEYNRNYSIPSLSHFFADSSAYHRTEDVIREYGGIHGRLIYTGERLGQDLQPQV